MMVLMVVGVVGWNVVRCGSCGGDGSGWRGGDGSGWRGGDCSGGCCDGDAGFGLGQLHKLGTFGGSQPVSEVWDWMQV